jgi:hypothetical protein
MEDISGEYEKYLNHIFFISVDEGKGLKSNFKKLLKLH